MKLANPFFRKSLFCIITAILFSCQTTLAQRRIAKFFKKLESAFLVGEADLITRYHSKLQSITDGKVLSVQDSVLMMYAESRFQRWAGNYDASEALAARYLRIARKRLGENSGFYADMLVKRAQVSFEAGDHQVCREALSVFLETARAYPVADSELVFKARLLQTRNALETGNLQEAAALIDQLVFKAENRLHEFQEIKGEFEELSYRQVVRRNHELLMVRVLQARLLRERGLIKEAGKELESLETFCRKKKIRNEDQAHIEYWFEKSKYLFETHRCQDAIVLLKKNLAWFSRRESYPFSYFKTHEQYLHMLETLVAYYLAEEDFNRAEDYEEACHRVMRKRFPKASVYAARALIPQSKIWDPENGAFVSEIDGILKTVIANRLPFRYTVRIFSFLREAAMLRDSVKRAESLFLKEIDYLKNRFGDQSFFYHSKRCELAGFYARHGQKLEDAELFFQESLHGNLSGQLAEHSMVILNAWNQEGLVFEYKNQFQKALSNYHYVLQIMERSFGKESFEAAVQQTRVAEMEMNLGEFASAEKKLLNSLKIIKKEGLESRLERSNCERILAQLYITTGRFLEADRYLAKSLRRRNGLKDGDLFRFNGMDDEIILLMHKGLFLEAQEKTELLIKRRSSYLNTSSHRTLVLPYQLSAQLFTALGQYAKAESSGLQACEVSKAVFGDTSIQYFRSQSVLSRVHASFGDYDRSLEMAQKSFSGISRYFGDQFVEAAQPLIDIAMVLLHKGADKNEVLSYLQRASDIIRKNYGENNPKYAEALQYTATFFLHSGMYQDARPLLEKADEIWKEQLGKNNVHTAEILLLLADIDARFGRVKQSRDGLESAASIYREIFSEIHPRYLEILPRISQSYFQEGKEEKAVSFARDACRQSLLFVEKFFPSMSDREKSRIWNTMRHSFEFFNTLAVKWHQKRPELLEDMYNNILRTKAILLSSSIQVRERILSSGDDKLIEKYKAWIRKKEEIGAALEMAPEERKLAGKDVRKMESQADGLEAELSKLSVEFSNSRKEGEVNWQNVKHALKSNERAVEMVRFRYFAGTFTDSVIYAALIINPSEKPGLHLQVFPEGKRMESSYARYYRKSVRLALPDTLSFSVFWKPLSKHLNHGGNVYFSPDGVFNELNPEGLMKADGKFVIEEDRIVTLASTRELLLRKNASQPKTKARADAMIVGNPNYYPEENQNAGEKKKIEFLPGTGKEVNLISKILRENGWKVHEVTGKKASEDTLKKIYTPKLLHIATHGYFMESPKAFFLESAYSILNRNISVDNPLLRSGLYLSDAGKVLDKIDDNAANHVGEGIFSALEAMNLHLANTDLVVLSACETGRGDVQVGEGVYGLHRSFQIAGSGAVIMSLFKVSDDATQELMGLFYQNWIQKKQPIREAFLSAKLELKKKFPQPLYWGSFVLVGGS